MDSDRDEEDEIIGGKLKLKGGVKRKTVKKKKKKKKKKDRKKRLKKDDSNVVREPEKNSAEEDAMSGGLKPYVAPSMTASERAFEARQRKREMERHSQMASKSHRQRVEEYNEYLAGLSEIHDIPKVGPG